MVQWQTNEPLSVHVLTDTRSKPVLAEKRALCDSLQYSWLLIYYRWRDLVVAWNPGIAIIDCTDCSGFTRKSTCLESTSVSLCLQLNKETHESFCSHVKGCSQNVTCRFFTRKSSQLTYDSLEHVFTKQNYSQNNCSPHWGITAWHLSVKKKGY